MAGERSIYRKLQVLLEYAKIGKHKDISELVSLIFRRMPTNFAYYLRDKNTDEVCMRISTRSIETTIDLAFKFGLISSKTGSLSKTGITATDPRRFPQIIATKTVAHLEKQGLSLEEINKVIKEHLLLSDPPELPTAQAIWSKLSQTEMDLNDFIRLMSILGEVGVLRVSQKKIYFP